MGAQTGAGGWSPPSRGGLISPCSQPPCSLTLTTAILVSTRLAAWYLVTIWPLCLMQSTATSARRTLLDLAYILMGPGSLLCRCCVPGLITIRLLIIHCVYVCCQVMGGMCGLRSFFREVPHSTGTLFSKTSMGTAFPSHLCTNYTELLIRP